MRVFLFSNTLTLIDAPAFLGTIANPAAPIILPVIAGIVVAVWLHNVYQNVYVDTSL